MRNRETVGRHFHAAGKKLSARDCRPTFIALCGLAAFGASAQSYPSKPLRMIVPYAAGGGVDIMARVISPRLSDSLGQQVVVDNRAGGGAIIGTDLVAKSAPDGYTLLMANPAHAANPALNARLPYDTVKNFSAVGLIATSSSMLVVHPSLPVKSVRELVALAKSKPGQLNYASGGIGSAIYLSMELFKSIAGVDIVHIAYKGAGPALSEVIGGQVPMMFATTPSALPHVNAGRLRVLAVGSAKRHALLPNVPTIAESGYPAFENTDWYGVLVPAGTSASIIGRLNADINAALVLPELKERIAGLGAEPGGGTPAQLDDRIKTEVQRWSKVLKHIEPEKR
jgi:tripartite-type tricarboxylate transporter receptor subunit TctC